MQHNSQDDDLPNLWPSANLVETELAAICLNVILLGVC
jgi:hypothetical protein